MDTVSAGPEVEVRTARGAMLYDASCIDQPGDLLFEQSYWRSRGALQEIAGGRGTVAFIRDGAIVADGAPDELRERFSADRLEDVYLRLVGR